jgi:hypothetical protein
MLISLLFFNNQLINVHLLKTTMYTFIQHDDNNQYDKKKNKPHHHVACASCFSKQLSSKGHLSGRCPIPSSSLAIDVESQKMNVCYLIIKFDTWRGANLYYLSWNTLDGAHVVASGCPIRLRMMPGFLFIVSILVVTTIWYVLYVLSLSWCIHTCLHRDSAKWLS